jgi:hypothetical protein
MSLVGSQVFANQTTPCWVPATGGIVKGNVEITGTLDVDGATTMAAATVNGTFTTKNAVNLDLGNGNFQVGFNDAAGAVNYARMYAGATNGGNLYLEAAGTISLAKNTAGNSFNTLFTPDVPGGTNDVLSVGGTVVSRALQSSTYSGTGSIAVLGSDVVVPCPVVKANSKIFLSHKGASVVAPAVVGPCQNFLSYDPAATVPDTSFTVNLCDVAGVLVVAVGVPVTFDWLVIN